MGGAEQALLQRIREGRLVEGPEHATERYLEGLKRTLVVSAGLGGHGAG